MNKLWESWVLYCVKRSIPVDTQCTVTGQSLHRFWSNQKTTKVVKPDILIRFKDGRTPIILDSKWKVPDTPVPSDDDLKQMYVYEKLLGSNSSTLIYPEVHLKGTYRGLYADAGHTLQMTFIDPAEKMPRLDILK